MATLAARDLQLLLRPVVSRFRVGLVLLLVTGAAGRSVEAHASCASPAHQIEAENCLPGTPQSLWDVSGAGDPSLQGFATRMSVDLGETVRFKVLTDASAYTIQIYRLGWYQGNGARLVATVAPSASLPQTQPACLTDPTGLVDCGNWAVSASWNVPTNATSGIYVARLVRPDTGGASHVVFVVRDDAGDSDLLFQTSDTTWVAYNTYGGNSLYTGNPPIGRAYRVSYNRPVTTRTLSAGDSWLMNAEYPMVRWLESNGYDVSYTTGVDGHARGGLIQDHRVFLSNGHDEYWSATQRANVEAARDAGVHLAFFSGNTMFWKTRFEPSVDGSGTPDRTLVCYKETHAGLPIDPLDPPTWTGTWRDARFSPPADGGRPENALTGTIFRVNGTYLDRIAVPQADGRMRFWRNTSVALLPPGGISLLAPGSLGDELDLDWDNGFRPPGLFHLSTRPVSTSSLFLLDEGSSYGAGSGFHHMTLHRHTSGALVFSAGSYQWAWGLDAAHDRPLVGPTTDLRMQQATVNLLADMDAQPATLRPGLVPATSSSDGVAPSASITTPADGTSLEVGASLLVTGSATDFGGGVVGGVEVSTDGGATWHPALGRESWSYTEVLSTTGSRTILARAADDSGNLGASSAPRALSVLPCTKTCTIWPSTALPETADGGPGGAVELGVRFRSDTAGLVTGLRFFKHPFNTGTHVASLWTHDGTLLARATFGAESASGWQQVSFPAPVAISADTSYVASYHCPVSHFSVDYGAFSGVEVVNPPLRAPAAGPGAPNGVFTYAPTPSFPTSSYISSGYWVDVVFGTAPAPALASLVVSPADTLGFTGVPIRFRATGLEIGGGSQDLTAKVQWSSSDPGLAAIEPGGLVVPSGTGSLVISAQLGALVGTTPLHVTTAPPVGNCDDGFDNDGDGFVDYPADPGCGGAGSWAKESTQCQDGLDNDGDLTIDFPADASCSGPSDDTEAGGSCGMLGIEPIGLLLALRMARRRSSHR